MGVNVKPLCLIQGRKTRARVSVGFIPKCAPRNSHFNPCIPKPAHSDQRFFKTAFTPFQIMHFQYLLQRFCSKLGEAPSRLTDGQELEPPNWN